MLGEVWRNIYTNFHFRSKWICKHTFPCCHMLEVCPLSQSIYQSSWTVPWAKNI